jgi:hypothetical protein
VPATDHAPPGGPRDLLPPVVPFAVRPGSEVRPDLWRLDRALPPHADDPGPAHLVRLDAEVPVLVAAKRELVTADPGPWTAVADDLDLAAAEVAGRRLAAVVAGLHPELVRIDGETVVLPGDGVRVGADGEVTTVSDAGTGTVAGARARGQVLDRLRSVEPRLRPLEAVALGIAEDVVLVEPGGRAVWLHVCAPSGWDPGGAGGALLAALHGPVPHADRLVAASSNLARAIVSSGPHVRWVWGLSEDPAAAQHPAFPPPPRPALPVADLTFRAERQTTLPLADLGLGVFLIRVHRTSLSRAVAAPGRPARLAATVRSLPPALAGYKGVADRRDELLRWLDGG